MARRQNFDSPQTHRKAVPPTARWRTRKAFAGNQLIHRRLQHPPDLFLLTRRLPPIEPIRPRSQGKLRFKRARLLRADQFPT